jgi:hypothetical protein
MQNMLLSWKHLKPQEVSTNKYYTLELFYGVNRKNLRALHTFLYTLCLICIYYKINLGDSPLYHTDS